MKTSGFVAARIPDRLLVSACTLFALVISNAAMPNTHAATVNWLNNAGGSFTDPGNWDNVVPGSADTAVFRRGGLTYDVNFASPIANDFARVGNDTVSFRSSDASAAYSISDSLNSGAGLVIGELPGERGVLNDYLGSTTTSSLILGQGAGSNGVLNILAGTFNVTQTVKIGLDGTGELNVLNGAVFNSPPSGVSLRSGASITVSGPGSRWNHNAGASISIPINIQIRNGGEVSYRSLFFLHGAQAPIIVDGTNSALTLYQLGFLADTGGSIVISNGGKMSTSYVDLANNPSQTMVTVDGAGSVWTHNGHLSISGGTAAPAVLIKNGGKLATTDGELGSGGGRTVSIDGPGASWSNAGLLSIKARVSLINGGNLYSTGLVSLTLGGTFLGNGTVDASVSTANGGTIAPGEPIGLLTIAGNYDQKTNGNLQIDLSSTSAGLYDRLLVTGSAALDGVLTISLTNGFVPSQGDTFDILDAASISGHFADLQLPTLPKPLGWDTSALYTTGAVSIVPEPSTLALLTIGALGICLHRKRRLN
jgi:T5SS/PEP-CTERM-associated repeat protein